MTRPGNDSILLFHPMYGSYGSTVAPGIPLSLLTVAAPLAGAREIEKGETMGGGSYRVVEGEERNICRADETSGSGF